MNISATPIEPSALGRWPWRQRLGARFPAVLMAMVFTLFTTGAAPGEARTRVVGSDQDTPSLAIGMNDATASGFRVPHAIVHGAIFVRKGETSIRSEDDLAGASIIAMNGDVARDNALNDQWLGVHDEKGVGLRDLLNYIVPVVGFFLLLLGYLRYRQLRERALAHAAVAQSRELLLTIMETLPLRVFWKDRDLRFLGCNSAFARDAGLSSPSELIGKDEYQMGWAAQAQRHHANEKAVMASGTARLFFDEPQTTPSGQTIWLRTSKVPLKNGNGEVIGVLGLYEDITERHQAEEKLRQLGVAVEQSPASVLITDLNATIEYVNPRFTAVTGYSAAEVIGQNARMLQSGLTPREVHAELWRQLSCGLAWHGELIDRRKNGEVYWADSQIAPVKDASGAVTHYVAVMTDISARKQLENERQESSSRLQKIASRLPGVVYQFRLRPDGSSCFPYASDAMVDNFRVRPEEVREDASKVFAIFHPEDLTAVVASIQSSARDLSLWRQEFRVKFGDGTVHWMLGSALPQKEDDGAVLWHGFITDITQRKREEAVFRGLFDQSLFLAGIVDQQGRLIDVNSTALKIAGISREQVIGQHFPDTPWWSDHQDRGKLIECLALASTGHPSSFEATHPTPDGGSMSVMFSAMPIVLEDGIQVAVVGVDITRRKELEDQVRELAFHDPLTKLPNRRLLNDRLSRLMASSKRSNCYGALMFLDLDNFKPLNDLHGHDFGDLLLIEVARRLISCVREIDTVARIGGDEFVVMLSDLNADKSRSTEEAALIAEKIRLALAAPYRLTVTREGKPGAAVEHRCSASIGVVLFVNHEASQEDILKWADAAMYAAKAAGRNTIRFHNPSRDGDGF